MHNAPGWLLLIGWKSLYPQVAERRGLQWRSVLGAWEQEHLPSHVVGGPQTIFVPRPDRPDEVLAAVQRLNLDVSGLVAVIPCSDEYVGAAAALSDAFGLRSGTLRKVPAWRDKHLQSSLVGAAGARTAQHHHYADIRTATGTPDVAFPAVLKPSNAAGASGFQVLERAEDLPAGLAKAQDDGRYRAWILESYVPHVEHQIDVVVHQGEVLFLSVGRYLLNCGEAGLARRPVCTVFLQEAKAPAEYAAARGLIDKVVRALAIDSEVLHVEGWFDGEAFWFGECGVRLGGLYTPEAVRHAYGVDLGAALLDMRLGRRPRVSVRPGAPTVAKTTLPWKSGRLSSLPPPARLAEVPGLAQYEFCVSEGFQFPKTAGNAVTRIGDAVVTGSGVAEVVDRCASLWSLVDQLTVTEDA